MLSPVRQLIAAAMAIALLVSPAGAERGKGEPNPRMDVTSSPYLQSHSRDLVRWYAWGDEAFERARKLDRPILLSFGYLACHWCHVMQELHFNDADIAGTINDRFVPVLIDRERRTALDETYMLVTELMTKRGGWPNTVFLTPDLKPFFGTAYISPEDFAQLLAVIVNEWAADRASIVLQSERTATVLSEFMTRKEQARAITSQALTEAATALVSQFDEFTGGMGQGPRFFRPTVLKFLLQHHQRTGDTEVLAAVERTLQSILSGGIHDHLEGGFHRYAIDPGWRVPHFEKMLYDQAQLVDVFRLAYRMTGKIEYAHTASKTADYVLADLTAPEGAFYATRDADSEGEEGTYYVWTPEQLVGILGHDDAEYALDTFGLIADGDFAGKVIINMDNVRGQSIPRLSSVFARLADARKQRPKPVRDEKVLVSWNALMISALAHAAHSLDEPRYRTAATRAAHFIWKHMRATDGTLLRSFYAGVASVEGELEDYAHLARAFVALYDTTGETIWLARARELVTVMTGRFQDPDAGDFFATSSASGFARTKPRSDLDQASGNGAALDVLALLANRANQPDDRHQADKAIAALSGLALKDPAAGASILAAADRHKYGETGSLRYAGKGAVRIVAVPDTQNGRIVLNLDIARGWHINAHEPLEDHLIPTRLSLTVNDQKTESRIGYPTPQMKSLSFNDKPMALLENQISITAGIENIPLNGLDAVLDLQVCSDTLCLLPETVTVRVYAADEHQMR